MAETSPTSTHGPGPYRRSDRMTSILTLGTFSVVPQTASSISVEVNFFSFEHLEPGTV
jgi:hypothetical protein